MANSYTRADCVAAWRFEDSPGFLKDSKSIQVDLTNTGSGVTEDTTNQMEGAKCAAFPGTKFLNISDANLVAGFPFKSGDVTKMMTIGGWFRPTTVDTNKRVLFSKTYNTGNQRSWKLTFNSTSIYFTYSLNGTGFATEINTGATALTANEKYYILFSIDGITGYYWLRVYKLSTTSWQSKSGVLTGAIFAGTAEFRLGWDQDQTANCSFIGQMDEVLVFNSRLHNSEGVALAAGTFPIAAGNGIYDYLYDPAMAADTYDGFSSAAAAYKTMKHNFGPGDIIHGQKCVETAQGGGSTATATNGSESVTGVTGWTPAQYDIIRFDADDHLYMVQGFGGTTITLYNAYRGITGGGKIINKLTLITITSQDFTPTTGYGSYNYPIIFNGGVNLTNLVREGFSIYNGASAYIGYNASLSYWNMYRLGGYNTSSGLFYSGTHTGHNFEKVYLFRMAFSAASTVRFYSCVFTDVVQAAIATGTGCYCFNCVWNNPDIGWGTPWSLAEVVDTIVNSLRCGGTTSTNPSLVLLGWNWGYRLINPILDELGKGGYNVNIQCPIFAEDVVLENPTLGGGLAFSVAQSALNDFLGEVDFVNVNGVATDQRAYVGQGTANTYVLTQPDYTVYNTAAPSVKVTLGGAAAFGLFYTRHYVPCEAGVQRTISAYLRKNPSYGSAGGANVLPYWSLPFMRLRWFTGTTPNLVENVYDAPMADVNDAFQLVSHAVTPSYKGTIIVEFYFNSPNAGAIGWYDDVAG